MRLTSAFAGFVMLLAGMVLTGCKGEPVVSEIFGFQCTACNAKFYTSADVKVMHCPECKKEDFQVIVKYTCPKDSETVYAQNSRAGAPCPKCRTAIEVGQYPTEDELKAWGASKKSKSDVGG